MDVDRHELEVHAVAREPAHVEEIVDQARLHLDVSMYDLERLAQRRRDIGAIAKRRHRRENRCERRTQLVRKLGEKAFLGLTRGTRRRLARLRLAPLAL